ncbi:MAG: hypothetical protein C4539_06310 [Ignavibacteriales bacterium]|nr:MAG: hypothetical protein C4539_06310 [Ignavibacteriales bacterium]
MENVMINRKELKEIINEVFVDVLSERKDLIGSAVIEAFEDIGLAKAIEVGQTGEYLDVTEFKKRLDKKIKSKK